MTDRELLEAAAKAAGYWSHEFNCAASLPTPGWNPLTDDGDALRLAVRLHMRVSGGGVDWVGKEWIDAFEEDEADEMAATRRAIVRAAAEMAALKR